MASSIIHLAITNELTKQYEFKNVDRLKLGSVLPDASDNSNNTHLKISTCGYNKKTYDFDKFRSMFGNLLLKDDLYLGYYLHLVQDILFRHFVYDEYNWNPLIAGNIDRLHRDYQISNYYVVTKYKLDSNLSVPDKFNEEPICKLGIDDVDSFVENVAAYFKPVDFDDTFFFTTKMADEFIEKAVVFSLKEIEKLEHFEKGISAYEYGWHTKTRVLLKTTLNTRDLGGYKTCDGKITLYNRILRSDVQNSPSEQDIAFLKKNNITTIIDMRGIKDVERKPSGFATLEGFEYYNIPIDEGSGVPESVEAVPYSYLDIARAKSMPSVFRTIAYASNGIMFNCTAGKDRTGVVSALILSLCGVSKDDIVMDYITTKECSQERFELIHKNFPDVDMNIVIPNENYIITFLRLLMEEYGDVKGYFEAIGVTEPELSAIRNKLC